jgi:trehalose/maltose transport system permease protein
VPRWSLSLGLAVTAPTRWARPLRGRRLLLMAILAVSMFPQVAVLSGMFELMRRSASTTAARPDPPYMIFTLPFTVWVLTTFMRELPRELEEAAIMDGCGPLRIIGASSCRCCGRRWCRPGCWPSSRLERVPVRADLHARRRERTVPVAIALISGASAYELPWGRSWRRRWSSRCR